MVAWTVANLVAQTEWKSAAMKVVWKVAWMVDWSVESMGDH